MLNPLQIIFRDIAPDASVLDVGCVHFRQVGEARLMGKTQLKHAGVDIIDLTGEVPAGVDYRRADLSKEPIPFADDSFDLVVAAHILEHMPNPIEFFGECVRVCKPGGTLYVEAPSERSLLLPGMPFKHDKFYSLSFYDDPTHMFRPWTPQSLHRLTRYFHCTPLRTGYRTSWKHRLGFPVVLPYALLTRNAKLLETSVWYALGWTSYLQAQKPTEARGPQAFSYFLP